MIASYVRPQFGCIADSVLLTEKVYDKNRLLSMPLMIKFGILFMISVMGRNSMCRSQRVPRQGESFFERYLWPETWLLERSALLSAACFYWRWSRHALLQVESTNANLPFQGQGAPEIGISQRNQI